MTFSAQQIARSGSADDLSKSRPIHGENLTSTKLSSKQGSERNRGRSSDPDEIDWIVLEHGRERPTLALDTGGAGPSVWDFRLDLMDDCNYRLWGIERANGARSYQSWRAGVFDLKIFTDGAETTTQQKLLTSHCGFRD